METPIARLHRFALGVLVSSLNNFSMKQVAMLYSAMAGDDNL